MAQIDNAYWPMMVGAIWTYTGTDAEGNEQRVVVEVTAETRQILGITAIVVHDRVTQDDELVEDTLDWYAQDSVGNVWYLGEDTREYQNGAVVSTEGSWEAGVDGALPGVIVPADPLPGMTYRQEYYAGHAEDAALVMSLTEQVALATRTYIDVLMTRDYTPLHPDVVELKFYAPGVGPVLVIGLSPELSREELIQLDLP